MRVIALALFALSVSANAPIAHADFHNNSDGTVTDLGSNLTWQRCSAPSKETDCANISPSLYAWDDALAYCETLTLGGYADWRLPNVKELHSLVDVTKAMEPAINTTYFPDTRAADYWSSTTLTGTGSYGWSVQFSIGLTMTSGTDKRTGLYARCVRGG